MKWFEIEVLYSVFNGDDEDGEMSDISILQAGGNYKTGTMYADLREDPIIKIHPNYLIWNKGQDKQVLTEVIFHSGMTVTALGSTKNFYKRLSQWVEANPVPSAN